MSSPIHRVLFFAAFATGMTNLHAEPVEHTGRGIFHFDSQSGCPFSDAATTDCNRVALDTADVRASIDTQAHRIVFSSGADHRDADVLGDVLLQGSGVSADGQRVPLSVQVLLRRKQTGWSRDVYARAPVAGKFTDVRIDPYRIQVQTDDGKNGERDLFTPEEIPRLFGSPSFAARLASYLVQVRPSDPKRPVDDDITISLGIGRLTMPVARTRFSADRPNDGNIDHALAGDWSLRIDALSSYIPDWVVRRQLFLFGLEDQPLLKEARANGLKKNDRLEIGAHGGQGYLQFNEREEAFAGAATAGRALMRESFFGLILGWHRP